MNQTKSNIDAAAGESIMTKTYEAAYELMEMFAFNLHQMIYDKMVGKSTPGVLQMDTFSAICTNFSIK